MRHSSKLYKFITRRPPVATHHPLVSYYNAMPRTITIAPMNIRPLTTSSPRTTSSSSSSQPSSAPFAKDIEQFGQTYRPRRALLYMPGSSPKMLLKATTLTQVDVVCMDLEDSVAEHQKVEARKNIVEALNKWKVEPYVKGQHRTERLGRNGGREEIRSKCHKLVLMIVPSKLLISSIRSTAVASCRYASFFSSHQSNW